MQSVYSIKRALIIFTMAASFLMPSIGRTQDKTLEESLFLNQENETEEQVAETEEESEQAKEESETSSDEVTFSEADQAELEKIASEKAEELMPVEQEKLTAEQQRQIEIEIENALLEAIGYEGSAYKKDRQIADSEKPVELSNVRGQAGLTFQTQTGAGFRSGGAVELKKKSIRWNSKSGTDDNKLLISAESVLGASGVQSQLPNLNITVEGSAKSNLAALVGKTPDQRLKNEVVALYKKKIHNIAERAIVGLAFDRNIALDRQGELKAYAGLNVTAQIDETDRFLELALIPTVELGGASMTDGLGKEGFAPIIGAAGTVKAEACGKLGKGGRNQLCAKAKTRVAAGVVHLGAEVEAGVAYKHLFNADPSRAAVVNSIEVGSSASAIGQVDVQGGHGAAQITPLMVTVK
jgi:hypothetical protein